MFFFNKKKEAEDAAERSFEAKLDDLKANIGLELTQYFEKVAEENTIPEFVNWTFEILKKYNIYVDPGDDVDSEEEEKIINRYKRGTDVIGKAISERFYRGSPDVERLFADEGVAIIERYQDLFKDGKVDQIVFLHIAIQALTFADYKGDRHQFWDKENEPHEDVFDEIDAYIATSPSVKASLPRDVQALEKAKGELHDHLWSPTGINFDPEPVCLSELKADGFSYLCFVALFLEPLVQTDDGWQKPLFDGDFDGGEEVKKAVGQASYLFAAVCYYGCEKWLEKWNSEALKNHDADGISEVLNAANDLR